MTAKRRSQRSPAYPIVGLETAIEKLESYYRNEGQNIVSRDAAIESMGYASASGQSLQMMSTLIQYGLLEKTGTGQVKISDVGLAIMVGMEGERQDAILRSAVSPPIFSELKEAFAQNKPSTKAIASYLIQRKPKGYNHASANKICKAFHETIEFANLYGKEYNEPPEETDNKVRGEGQTHMDASVVADVNVLTEATLPLQEGMVKLSIPKKGLSKTSIGLMKQWVDLILRINSPTQDEEDEQD